MVAPFDIFVRADRLLPQSGYTLAPPRDLATGGRVFQMVLAVPGVMEYATGAEYVPPETLSDEGWLGALAGVPMVWDDTGTHLNANGEINPGTMEEISVGRILRAWWDDSEQCVKADAVVDTSRGLALIESGVRGVSPGYSAHAPLEGGTHGGVRYSRTQRRRSDPTNVALTGRPRGGVTTLRADSMDDLLEKMKALLDQRADAGPAEMLMALVEMMMGERGRADAAEAELAKMKADMAEPVDEPKADAVGAYDKALRLARSLGVDIKADATLVDLERSIADKLDVKADANSDYVRGAIDAAVHRLDTTDAADRVVFTQDPNGKGNRADSITDSVHPTWPGADA